LPALAFETKGGDLEDGYLVNEKRKIKNEKPPSKIKK